MQYKHWSANEIALMLYGRFKGYKYSTIAKALDKSPETLQQKCNSVKRGDYLRNSRSGKIIDKALQLEMKVRSGDAPDQERAWIVKLKRADGIETSFNEEIITTVKTELEPTFVEDIPEEEAKSEDREFCLSGYKNQEGAFASGLEDIRKDIDRTIKAKNKPLFTFDINVDEVIRIINAWKGK